MACNKSTSYSFSVFEIYPDGTEHNTGRTFTISKKEHDEYLERMGIAYRISQSLDTYGLLRMFFDTMGFTVGPSGFTLSWEDENTAILSWPGPREPAVRIGGIWWRLRRKL